MKSHSQKTGQKTKGKWGIVISTFLFFIFFFIIVILPNFPHRDPSPLTSCQQNMRNIGTALDMYASDNGGCYPPKMEMLTPDYLQTIPACPSSRTNRGYIDSYRVSKDFNAYTFYCQGDNHSAVGVDKNFPHYNSKEGLIYKP